MENFQFQPEEQSQEIPLYNEEEIESFQPVKTEETPQVEKSQDLSQPSDKIINRHEIRYTATRIKYSATRIKSRNFSSNISYNSINKNYFYNESCILDVYVLLVKNLNPFSIQRKISDKLKQEMVYMLWRQCIPPEFYRHICEVKNFINLNGRDVGQHGALEIVRNFVD